MDATPRVYPPLRSFQEPVGLEDRGLQKAVATGHPHRHFSPSTPQARQAPSRRHPSGRDHLVSFDADFKPLLPRRQFTRLPVAPCSAPGFCFNIPMRLTPAQQHTIKATAAEVFGTEVKVSLFGSRTDDTRKGGDIDLLIELPNPQPEVQRKRLSFVTRLQQRLGDQRIAVLIVQPNTPKQAIHACASHGDSFVNTTQMFDRARFLATLYIVAKESAHLEWSRQRLFSQPITPAWVDGLDTQPEPAERLEVFVSRYDRLQDTIADKLLPRWLRALAERPRSQIEVLNRAEQLGYSKTRPNGWKPGNCAIASSTNTWKTAPPLPKISNWPNTTATAA
ncbi:nucleotidyltransferase domain-containing protein [Thiomonas sp. 13-64-67]|uniref:nucleotidyltransferase domain-containing protein n=2 Tax=unclassified Thiomonas TaxID=2625466 RepID=UPI002580A170|nr:nucleotidyltransferase domain-containing protein [Thiomonas sp. 13-64-67]